MKKRFCKYWTTKQPFEYCSLYQFKPYPRNVGKGKLPEGSYSRVPYICVSEESFAEIAEYASVHGRSKERVANDLIGVWWNEVGEWSVIQTIKQGKAKRRKRVPRNIIRVPRPMLVVAPKQAAEVMELPLPEAVAVTA